LISTLALFSGGFLTQRILLKKGHDARLLGGHLWVFSNEIHSIEGNPAVGDVVDVRRIDGKFIGRGFYHPHSLIAVRIMTWSEEEITPLLFTQRISLALSLRKTLYPASDTYRLVHGESDFLPGLIIDRYNDLFSIQTLSAGVDRRLDQIIKSIIELFNPRTIVERNESAVRALEELPVRSGFLHGSDSSTTSDIDGIKYEIDVLQGQKTGFFLDQRENRKSLQKYTKGKTVLDCFCNDGGFALNAAAGGASNIEGVDSSDGAIARARTNAVINGFDSSCVFRIADVFETLRTYTGQGRLFDVVVLDPPSFTKSRKTVNTAKRGYADINTMAMKIVTRGGILATASCSHHITEETFLDIIKESAMDAGRQLQQVEWHGAAPDHPVLPAMPETRYLKFGIFRVV
jgi:23S rRNA (cytosine1962-C5)-methyltransferase